MKPMMQCHAALRYRLPNPNYITTDRKIPFSMIDCLVRARHTATSQRFPVFRRNYPRFVLQQKLQLRATVRTSFEAEHEQKMATSHHKNIVLRTYRSLLRSAKALEVAAGRRQSPIRTELARFALPLGPGAMEKDASIQEVVRNHFHAFRHADKKEAIRALDGAFDALRLASERVSRLSRVDYMGREAGAAFHVGQLARHRKYNYRFVIFGWHKTCRMSEEWVRIRPANTGQILGPLRQLLLAVGTICPVLARIRRPILNSRRG